MLRFVVRRLLISLVVILGVTAITYGIISLVPGDVVDFMIGPGLDQAGIEALRRSLGLTDPIPVRYVKWLGQIVQGNLGYSFNDFRPVTVRIGERIAPTLTLMASSILISYLLAIPIGLLAAVKQYSRLDYLSTLLALSWASIPTFFLGLGGIYLLSLRLNLLPTGGTATIGGEPGPLDQLHHLILPALVLGLNNTGSLIRYTRAGTLDVINQDFVRTARAKGLAEWVLVRRHVLRNALLPIVTLAGLSLPHLLGGAVITEQVFQWPGIGRMTLDAIAQRDYPLLMGVTLMTAVLVVVGNLLADLAYGWLDPRIRLG